jgi:hypothetical protein
MMNTSLVAVNLLRKLLFLAGGHSYFSDFDVPELANLGARHGRFLMAATRARWPLAQAH